MIYHKFVLIFEFKYILLTMQPRLKLTSNSGTPFIRLIIKALIIISAIGVLVYFVEKIDLPSPKKEIIEDVNDKINKLK